MEKQFLSIVFFGVMLMICNTKFYLMISLNRADGSRLSIQNYNYLRLGKMLKFMTNKEQKDKKTDPSQANREEETNLSKDKDVQNHNEEVDEVEVDSSNNEAESSISAEEQEELLKKYDADSNTRDV